MYCARCTCLHVCGTWDRPTNRVRTIDSFGVISCKWNGKRLENGLNGWFKSGGYFFVHCLRNNLSFWFREPVSLL